MKRVLRITAVIFGIGLIGMVGVLGIIRRQNEADPVLLVSIPDVNQWDKAALYLMDVGSAARQRISPHYYSFADLQWSPDKEWLYVVAWRTYEASLMETGDIWRISRDGQRVEPFDPTFVTTRFVTSPDGKWLITYSEEATGQTDLVRVQANDGSHPQNLTAEFEPSVWTSNLPEVSEDGQWVYFQVMQNDILDVYRISIDGGIPENLTAEIDATAHLVIQTKDWLLFKSDAMLYITDPDGSNLRPLLAGQVDIDDIGLGSWLPERNLLIVGVHLQNGNQLWALEMPTGVLKWQHDDFSLLFSTVSSDGSFIAIDRLESLYYVGLDGSPPLPINPGGMIIDYHQDEPIILQRNHYIGNHVITDDFEFWQLLPDGNTRFLYQPVSREVFVIGWSWDLSWVAIRQYPTDTGGVRFILVKADGRQSYRIENGTWQNVLTWLPPIDRAWSPIGMFIIGGGLLLGGMVRRRRKAKL